MSRVSIPQPPVFLGQDTQQTATQLYSYLFQLSEQLNVVLNTLSEDQFTDSARKALASGTNVGVEQTEREMRDQYARLRSLIISTANTIESEMETMRVELEGTYVAQSDFGTYTEQTNATIEANAANITQNYNAIMTMMSDMAGFEDYVTMTEAYIKTGLLDNTVTPPVYGVEIGQRNNDEAPNMVRITADRIGFYQNGYEACYIANGRWGAPGIDVDSDIKFNSTWETGVDASGRFYVRYIGG